MKAHLLDSPTLTLDALESDLRVAEVEFAKVTAARERAEEVENQWKTEVGSLRNLIEVRRQRLHPFERFSWENSDGKTLRSN